MAELPLEVLCHEVKAAIDAGEDFVLIDCREVDEHATARIESARLVPMSEMEQRVQELHEHREQRVVVHCHHGGRSLRVVNWLREQGFAQAQSMAGGIDAWSCSIDQSIPRY